MGKRCETCDIKHHKKCKVCGKKHKKCVPVISEIIEIADSTIYLGSKLACDTDIINEEKIKRIICVHTESTLEKHGIPHIIKGSSSSSYSSATDHISTHIRIYAEGGGKYTTFPALYQIAIDDESSEKIDVHFDDCIKHIERGVSKGENILIHCNKGKSRSVTILAAYLIWKKGWSYKETLEYIHGRRFIAKPNRGFKKILRKWDKNCKSSSDSYDHSRSSSSSS